MNEKDYVPFERTHRLRPLYLVIAVVGRGQGDAISGLFLNHEAYFSVIHKGTGTAPRDFYAFPGAAVPKKDVVFSIIKQDKWPILRNILKERFAISKVSSGLCSVIPIDAISGVSIYKMLSNTRQFEKPVNKYPRAKKEAKKHE